ncbi:Prephenate dehydratase-domain-containing protein [Chaetomium sp. MPI-SDFR-AT-0129]|nr:Prephenate dehydratase-domain-containing protein [Chaetomium sp. MPI-SDFR-AT-0129]
MTSGNGSDNSVTVAFLGPVNSYTHRATKNAFSDPKWTFDPTTTIKEVFDRVQAGHAPYGVVPFENSTHGAVTFTLDSLADRANEYPDIVVCDEVYLDIHHFLLGRLPEGSPPSSSSASQDKGVPLTPLTHLRRVYSHPQAFGQTARFLQRYLPGVETVEVSSTSRAAELAKADESGTSAAIASESAGKAIGLDVLARWIEDREDNTTRFFVLRRGEAWNGGGVPGRDQDQDQDQDQAAAGHKSLVSFTVPHRQPGALADVLNRFRGRGLNLTSISSVPSLDGPFQYLFFVEFEGGRFDDPEGQVGGVLEDLEGVAERWRWLGSWRNRRE